MTIRKPWAILTSALLVLATAACTAPGSTTAAPSGSGSSGRPTCTIPHGLQSAQPRPGRPEGTVACFPTVAQHTSRRTRDRPWPSAGLRAARHSGQRRGSFWSPRV